MSSSTAAFFFLLLNWKYKERMASNQPEKRGCLFWLLFATYQLMRVDAVPDELLWSGNQLHFTSGQLLLWLVPYLDSEYLAMEGLLSPTWAWRITRGLQELQWSSVDCRIGVYVLKKKTISVTCISSGTELTALFTMRCPELGSSTGKEVSVSFRDVLCLGYSAVRDVLTVGLRFTALLFDEHQYFSFVSLGPSGGTVEPSLGAVCRSAVPLSSSFWSFHPRPPLLPCAMETFINAECAGKQ